MRTLSDILEAAKDGGSPPLAEELLYAMLALEQLWSWDARHYREAVLGDKKPEFVKMRLENDFQRGKKAMAVDPKVWLGPNHDWNNPENRRRRAVAVKLYERAVAGTLPQKTSG
jgi:hypothetical protein